MMLNPASHDTIVARQTADRGKRPCRATGTLMLHGRALRYIDEVARQGSIRKAAKTLNVAASAINRYILDLEQELDAPIFERLSRGLKLTSSGEILIAHIRETLKAHETMRVQIKALRGLSRGEVVIATMATLAAGRLADIIAAYRADIPQVSLRIKVGIAPRFATWSLPGRQIWRWPIIFLRIIACSAPLNSCIRLALWLHPTIRWRRARRCGSPIA